MGQRANLVVFRDDDWRLYYDHWCANRLDIELFWGAENATAFVQQRSALADRDDWLDEVWCEGGAIIDHDKKFLLWFGGEDIWYDIPLRRAHLALMALQWTGWEIKWASGGIADLGADLEYPTSKFLTDWEPDESENFRQLTEHPEDNNILLTVRERGHTTVTRVCGDEAGLEIGTSQLQRILRFPRSQALEWSDEMPQGGLHFDLDNRSLYYWFANPSSDLDNRISRRWPAWQCINLNDHYERHLQLAATADIQLPQRGAAELQQAVIDQIRRSCTKAASNPAKELSHRIGENAELGPWTYESRGSLGPEIEKRRILGEIEKKLPMSNQR